MANRIVYGATCAWWDGIDKVAKHSSGLPCCPHCKGVLYETNEASWWQGVDRHQVEINDPHYRAYVEWSRGQCFPNYRESRAAFDAFKFKVN